MVLLSIIEVPMDIIRTSNGFTEILEHSVINHIEFDFNGTCKVFYSDGTVKNVIIRANVYHLQYGIPASEDGTILFLGNWDDGIWAIDINTNMLRWHIRQKKVRKIFAYDQYITALKQGSSIYKIDIKTGEILAEIRSSTIEKYFKLDNQRVLVDRIKGKLSIVNTQKMIVEKTFSREEVNPNSCLSLIIQKAFYMDGDLYISGFEKFAQGNHQNSEQNEFIRSLS